MNVQKKMKTWRKKLLNLCLSRNHCWNILSTTEIDGQWVLSSEDWREGVCVGGAEQCLLTHDNTQISPVHSLPLLFANHWVLLVSLTGRMRVYFQEHKWLKDSCITSAHLSRERHLWRECVGESNNFFLGCNHFFWFQAWITRTLISWEEMWQAGDGFM